MVGEAYTQMLDPLRRRTVRRRGIWWSLDTQMLTGALLDRIVNQVQFAPWIKRNFGTDVADPEYKRRWCASNVDLFLRGALP